MMTIITNDVVIRYIRVRKGYNSSCFNECGAGILGFPSAFNVMIDHVSLQWNQDEGMGVVNGSPSGIRVRDWTLSYNLVGEGIGSVDETRSTGWFLGGAHGQAVDMRNIDLHHNLTMNNSHRNPLIRIKSSRLVNNLWYNLRTYANHFSGGVSGDVIRNKYKAGPLRPNPDWHEIGATHTAQDTLDAPGIPSIYVLGNVGWHQTNPAGDQTPLLSSIAGENGPDNGPMPAAWRRSSPMANTTHPITAEPVANIEASILPIVGASRRLDCSGNWVANRDAHDAKMVNEYKTNTGPNVLHP